MGRPMARTLRAGLPRATTLYVYDVSPGAMDACVRACAESGSGSGSGSGHVDPAPEGESEGGSGECESGGEGRGRVVPCASCREVGEHSVRNFVC